MLEELTFIAYLLLLLAAAVCDARRYVIPDAISLALVGLFLAAACLLPGRIDWSSHLAAGALVFAGGSLLFGDGRLGGGDVKLLSAVALWSGLEGLPALALGVSLAGGALAVALVLLRRALAGWSAPPRALRRGEAVPYALAIAAGALAGAPPHPFGVPAF